MWDTFVIYIKLEISIMLYFSICDKSNQCIKLSITGKSVCISIGVNYEMPVVPLSSTTPFSYLCLLPD